MNRYMRYFWTLHLTMQLEIFDDAITSTYPMILSEVKGARNNNKNIHLNPNFA